MSNTPDTQHASPLARALAAQSAAHLGDLERARGVDGSTFKSLGERAARIADTVSAWDPSGTVAGPIRAHAATLDAVARLLDDPGAGVIAPSNDRIYAAVLDITELDPIVRTLGETDTGRAAIRRHLETTDPATGHADRLMLAFGEVCKRGGLSVTLPATPGETAGLEIAGWRCACAPAVPLAEVGFDQAVSAADAALRARKRPGLIVLEAGPLLPRDPITVAEDRVAIGVMNDRLDAFMRTARGRVLDAVGDDQAFGLVVHATLPATNAASKRLLFAECFRAVNLCDASDPRAEGFRDIAEAMTKAG